MERGPGLGMRHWTLAQHLRGNLLLVHDTGDDNGHYRGTEMLMNELLVRNTPFTVLPYPDRSHRIPEGTTTLRHFHSTLTRHRHKHLPTGQSRKVPGPGKDEG